MLLSSRLRSKELRVASADTEAKTVDGKSMVSEAQSHS